MARLRVFLLAKPKRDSQTLERIDRGVGEGRKTLINTRARENNTYVQEEQIVPLIEQEPY